MAYTSTYSGAQADAYITKTQLVNLVYPVGSIYLSMNEANPSTYLGGTWVQIPGRFLVGCSSTTGFTAGTTGGTDAVTLTETQTPAHTHPIEGFSSSSTLNASTWIHYTSTGEIKVWGKKNTAGDNQLIWGGGSAEHPAGSGSHFRGGYIGARDGETAATGGDLSHNNVPPFISVYIWKRTA